LCAIGATWAHGSAQGLDCFGMLAEALKALGKVGRAERLDSPLQSGNAGPVDLIHERRIAAHR
jgi:hypothetical protein